MIWMLMDLINKIGRWEEKLLGWKKITGMLITYTRAKAKALLPFQPLDPIGQK